MASISRDSSGNRTVQFIAGDGKRRSVRLGKLPVKIVNEIKLKIQALNGAAISKLSVDSETAKWVGRLDSVLYKKLAAVGLVPKRAEPDGSTLATFIASYLEKRTDIKPRTRTNLSQVKRNLILYFGGDKPLADISEGDADDWRLWLADTEVNRDKKIVKSKLGPNTVRRQCGRARQLFRAALKRRVIQSNPFAEMKDITVQSNKAREYFVTRDEAVKCLEACPDAQRRLIFALSRFGGLRCPSEHLALRWSDINWEQDRMTVRSPKTEHHEGKESRVVPIFPELRPYLDAVWDEAQRVPGPVEYVITRYRDADQNLRTHFQRIIQKAGLKSWPKLFQNLRSTRETELGETFPIQVVCEWMGNSQAVARKHYLQVTEDHYRRAIANGQDQAVQNPVQQGAETACTKSHGVRATPGFSASCESLQCLAGQLVPPAGLEPAT